MQDLLDNLKKEYENIISRLRDEIMALRVGRATPALVENILIEAYGQKMPLKNVASISVSDPKTIVIQPWDKGLFEAIIKGLEGSQDSMHPVAHEDRLLVALPQLTEERREELLKLLSHKMEGARIALRQRRDDARSTIQEAEKQKKISEDEKFRLQKKIQDCIDEYTEIIVSIGAKKEREIRS